MKKLMTIVISTMLCVALFAGCGQAEEKELTGTIDEIKDFMFVITDENDTPYSFTFEEKPEGLENVSEGDTVTVKYTGTISEVDPFEGEVISVEKTNQNSHEAVCYCYDCVCIYDAGSLHRNSAETKDTWCNIYGREQYDY